MSELAAATLLGVAVWTGLLLMNDFFFIARQAIQKDLGLGLTLDILGFKLPNDLVLAIPVGTLLGSLVAIGRLSADGEIVALQAAGWGPRRLLRPMLLHGLLAFAASFGIYAFVQPWASYEIRLAQGRILNARNATTELKPRVFFSGIPGYVLFADEIPPGTRGLLDRAILYESPQAQKVSTGKRTSTEQLIIAKTATVGPAEGDHGALRIVFHDGVVHAFDNTDPEAYRSFQFQTFSPAPIEPPAWMRGDDEEPDKTVTDMLPRELAAEARAARAEPDKLLRTYRLRAVAEEIQKRFAIPLASLLFAVLALPLGVSRVRSGKGAGFAISLGIVLGYWIVLMTGLEQARAGRIPMTVGVWTANALVAVWAVAAYLGLKRSAAPKGRLARLRDAAIGAIAHRLERRRGPAESASERGRRAGGLRVSAVLDRYLGTLYLKMLALALAATYLIFVLIRLKGLMDSLAEHHQPPILLLAYFKYYLPGLLPVTLPFAAMIAAVVTVTLLGRTGEITALKASGMSAHRVCLPIVLLTVLMCGGLYLVSDRIAPETNRKAQAVQDRIEGRTPRTYGLVPGGRWTFGTGGRLYHYQLFDAREQRFQGLSVFRVDLPDARVLEQWFCATATFRDGAWQAERGWHRTFPEPGAAGEYATFERETIRDLDPPGNFRRSERSLAAGADLADQASLQELANQIAQLARAGYDTTKLRVLWWQKTASALTPLVTVLLGLPFAFKIGRRGSMYGVGVGLVLAIVFWATMAIFNALGLETVLPPFLAAWAPNVLYLGLGSYLLLYVPT